MSSGNRAIRSLRPSRFCSFHVFFPSVKFAPASPYTRDVRTEAERSHRPTVPSRNMPHYFPFHSRHFSVLLKIPLVNISSVSFPIGPKRITATSPQTLPSRSFSSLASLRSSPNVSRKWLHMIMHVSEGRSKIGGGSDEVIIVLV